MSLNIYLNESEIPKSIRFIRNNDKFFSDTSVENTVIVNTVLQRVETRYPIKYFIKAG